MAITSDSVQPGVPASAISHSEYNTGQVMPVNTELRFKYVQEITPEQSNYQNMNEISFLIDGRENVWTDLNNLEMEISLKMKKTVLLFTIV